jgi:hypothetical protein
MGMNNIKVKLALLGLSRKGSIFCAKDIVLEIYGSFVDLTLMCES